MNTCLSKCRGVTFTLFTLLFLPFSTAVLAEGIELKQCANGGINDPVTHEVCHEGWVKGNLNAKKAAYAEGEFVPYRAVLTDLAVGQEYTYRFSWDTVKKGTKALDYIGSFDASVTGANPCDGISPCANPVATVIDWTVVQMNCPLDFEPQPGSITGYNINSLEILSCSDIDADTRRLSLQFVPNATTAVIAWGGHIASPLDWGLGTPTASDIAGSPYHMSNIALLDSAGVSVAGGAQDAALSAAAVFVPSTINVTKLSNAPGAFEFDSRLNGNIPIPPENETNWWNLAKDQTKILKAQEKGTVTISEMSMPEGDWRVDSIVCARDGLGEVFSFQYDGGEEVNTAEFEVDAAGTFNCTFVNEFYGAPVLNVIKRVVEENGTCSDTVRLDPDNDTLGIRTGATVRYCYWVSNDGSDAAINVTLEDDLGGDPSIPVNITLSGGSELAPGGTVTGSLVQTLDLPFNSSLTNTATARGTGKVDGKPYSGSDTATVTADIESNCTLNASVYTDGACPDQPNPTVYVIAEEQTVVNWCAHVAWESGAVKDLTGISVALEGTQDSASGTDMSPGGKQDIDVGSGTENSTVTRKLMLTGWEGPNPISCEGQATVNVISPGLVLEKYVSTGASDDCGMGDWATSIEVVNGTAVNYCMVVTNTGDVPLENVWIDDSVVGISEPLGLGGDGLLTPDESITFAVPGDSVWSEDTTNTAVARGMEPNMDREFRSQASATVVVLRADVEVRKSADPGTIVLCEEGDTREFCSEPVEPGGTGYQAMYTITVSNGGPNEATGVVLTDELPAGFNYTGYTGELECSYEEGLRLFSCSVGDLESSESITIEIYGLIDVADFALPWQQIRNEACASTSPVELDPDPSNNCDAASTRISTGPTRTIGWWGTHPNGIELCLPSDTSQIDLGYLVIRDENGDPVDATISTDVTAKGKDKSNLVTAMLVDDVDAGAETGRLELAKGMLNAGTAAWGDGTQRSHIGQERVKASRQLTAAWCNERVLVSNFDEHFLSWPEIQLIMAGKAYLENGKPVTKGCNEKEDDGACDSPALVQKVIDSINHIGSVADMFNNSGDGLPFPDGFIQQKANPGAPEDDPTDPSD